MKSPILSVIICTHNPREEHLRRVIQALRAQTLPLHQWELLLIDNASRYKLADVWDLSWHPRGHHLREEELGLTPARLRGIQDSRGDILVFVDDDNVLSKSYIENATEILSRLPHLGAISGASVPEYEVPPPPWVEKNPGLYTVRRVERPCWSNDPTHWHSHPWGAGMCLTRPACNEYYREVLTSPERRGLDCKGTSVIAGGDIDMALTVLKLALGFGVFPELSLTHLISASRMTKEYFIKLVRERMISQLLLAKLRGLPVESCELPKPLDDVRKYYHRWKRSAWEKEAEQAILEARRQVDSRALS